LARRCPSEEIKTLSPDHSTKLASAQRLHIATYNPIVGNGGMVEAVCPKSQRIAVERKYDAKASSCQSFGQPTCA
jgi:hypothetical protein